MPGCRPPSRETSVLLVTEPTIHAAPVALYRNAADPRTLGIQEAWQVLLVADRHADAPAFPVALWRDATPL
jgi:hypothetical protein